MPETTMSQSHEETCEARAGEGPAATNGTRQPGAGPLGLPRAYWLLWLGMLLNRLGGSVFFLLAIYLTHDRGLRPELAGMVISLYAAGGMIAGPVGGVLADRLGRRTTLLAGTATAGTLMLALGFARSTSAIVLLAPLLGFCTDVCRPPLQAAVADLVPPAQRSRAYGLLYWAINLGFAGAAGLGGLLAERSFALLFVIDAVTTFAYGAIVLVGVPETRPALPSRPSHALRGLLAPFGDRAFMTFAIIQFPVMVAFAQFVFGLPLDMRAHGLGTDQIGWLLGLNGVVIVVAQPIALRLTARVPHVHLLAAGGVFVGLGLGLVVFAGGPVSYALTMVVLTLGEIAFSMGAPSVIADLAPSDRRGAYQGTFQLAWGLSAMTAPALGSFVLEHAGARTLWLACLAAGFLAAALHLTVTARRIAGRSAAVDGPRGAT
jgi:MFS family permease